MRGYISMTGKINNIILELSYYESEITKELNLNDDLGIDSLRMVELVVSIEEEFNIVINDSDLELDKLISVEDIYNLVNKYIN